MADKRSPEENLAPRNQKNCPTQRDYLVPATDIMTQRLFNIFKLRLASQGSLLAMLHLSWHLHLAMCPALPLYSALVRPLTPVPGESPAPHFFSHHPSLQKFHPILPV